MAEITDIENEFIREEIEEFLERPDEKERIVNLCLLYTSPSPRD